VKVIEEYLENALAFEQLAAVEIDQMLKDDFEQQAVAFRKLAAERAKRLGLGRPKIQTEILRHAEASGHKGHAYRC
jgi:hypothetical protein